ncbi:MAG TPA: GFA family protein [Porticoccaceae bacterium]|nr:GFA family protein [Porticoccaceae bacterium]
MKISGECFCKAISYESELDENRIGICHCRDCQIISGSAFRMSSVVPVDDFNFTRGMPKFFDKRADSGSVRRLAFCDICGTHLCSLPVDNDSTSPFVSIRLSTAREFLQLKPVSEIFCDSRVSWLAPLADSVQFSRMPTRS